MFLVNKTINRTTRRFAFQMPFNFAGRGAAWTGEIGMIMWSPLKSGQSVHILSKRSTGTRECILEREFGSEIRTDRMGQKLEARGLVQRVAVSIH